MLQSEAETRFGRQVHEQHPGWAADGARAMAAAADIIGEKHLAAAAAVLRAVANFDLDGPDSTKRSWRREAGCQSW